MSNIYRLEIDRVRDPALADGVQLSEIDLTGDRTNDSNPTPLFCDLIAAQGQNPPAETVDKLFDRRADTKWFDAARQHPKLLVLRKPFDSIEVTQLARTLTRKWYLAMQSALKLEQMELLVSQRTQKILYLQRRESYTPDRPDHRAEDSAAEELVAHEKPLILIVQSGVMGDPQCVQGLLNKYEVIVSDSETEALAKAVETVPDVIIIDTSAVEMHGMRLCRKLKTSQITSHVPVVLLAAEHANCQQMEASEAGADDYLLQSLSSIALQSRIENVLESRREARSSVQPGTTLQPRDLAMNQTDARFLGRAIAAIEQSLSDFEFGVDSLAQRIGISRRQLFRKLSAILDTTPHALIRSIRLNRAA